MALHFHNLQAPAASRLQAFQSSHLQARAATRLEWDFSDDFNRGDGPLISPWDNNNLFVSNNVCIPAFEVETTYANALPSNDGERDFTIEDAEASVDIGALWTEDIHTRWVLAFGDYTGEHRARVQVYYNNDTDDWHLYIHIGSVPTRIGGGAGHPAGTMTLTMAKRVVSVSFDGVSGGGVDEVTDCPSIVRLRYEIDAAKWSFPWFDNLVSHMEGY